MMNVIDFDGCVVVMAHPDDEILWASSVLRQARKIIICYSETPASEHISTARKKVFAKYPLRSILNLGITESNTYQSVDWRQPVEDRYGILCGRNRDAYKRNFHILADALQEHLEAGDVVVTHNPWGEYGHEEHVQVFRAVSQLKRQIDFRLLVTNYVSDRVLYFMTRNISRISYASTFLPVDKKLCLELKGHYEEHQCWTWDADYKWPDHECFYEVSEPDAPLRANGKAMSSLPMNVIWLDDQKPVLRHALRNLKRRCIALWNGFLVASALAAPLSTNFEFVL